MHQSRRLITAVEALNLLPVPSNDACVGCQNNACMGVLGGDGPQSIAGCIKLNVEKLRDVLGHERRRLPNSAGPVIAHIDETAAAKVLVETIGQLTQSYRATEGRSTNSGFGQFQRLLLQHRASSYPRQSGAPRHPDAIDYDDWLRSGWNLTKAKHRHIEGRFALPAPLPWRQNFPGLAAPDHQKCRNVQYTVVPPFAGLSCPQLPYVAPNELKQISSLGLVSPHGNASKDGEMLFGYAKQCPGWTPVFKPSSLHELLERDFDHAGRHVHHILAICEGSDNVFVIPKITSRARPTVLDEIELEPQQSRCAQQGVQMNVDVVIIDMTSRFMALQRLPRTIGLFESLGRQLDTGVTSFESPFCCSQCGVL